MFKVLTNKAREYIVRPAVGKIEGLSDIHIKVIMKPHKEAPDTSVTQNHKFLLLAVPMTTEAGPNPGAYSKLFNRTTPGYNEAMLRV